MKFMLSKQRGKEEIFILSVIINNDKNPMVIEESLTGKECLYINVKELGYLTPEYQEKLAYIHPIELDEMMKDLNLLDVVDLTSMENSEHFNQSLYSPYKQIGFTVERSKDLIEYYSQLGFKIIEHKQEEPEKMECWSLT